MKLLIHQLEDGSVIGLLFGVDLFPVGDVTVIGEVRLEFHLFREEVVEEAFDDRRERPLARSSESVFFLLEGPVGHSGSAIGVPQLESHQIRTPFGESCASVFRSWSQGE